MQLQSRECTLPAPDHGLRKENEHENPRSRMVVKKMLYQSSSSPSDTNIIQKAPFHSTQNMGSHQQPSPKDIQT